MEQADADALREHAERTRTAARITRVETQAARARTRALVAQSRAARGRVAPPPCGMNPQIAPAGLPRRLATARRLGKLIESGRRLLGEDIMTMPAPELLLALYVAEVEGTAPDAATLAGTLNMPATLAGRWLALLRERGLVTREGPESYRITGPCERIVGALLARAG